ncbi:hypothetical protein WA158_003804 [Blastocystis sp. Blastoise]
MGACMSSEKESEPVNSEIQNIELSNVQQNLELMVDEKAELEILKAKDKFTALRKRAEKSQDYNLAQSKKCVIAKNLEMAKFYLKLKVIEEDRIKDYANKVVALEENLNTIAEARDQKAFTNTILETRNCLQAIEKDMAQVEDIQKAMEDISDMQAHDNVINEMMANATDESALTSELEDEFNQLQSLVAAEEAASAPSVPSTVKQPIASSVPTKETIETPPVAELEHPIQEEEEEGELSELPSLSTARQDPKANSRVSYQIMEPILDTSLTEENDAIPPPPMDMEEEAIPVPE